jgi:hypothetical protein
VNDGGFSKSAVGQTRHFDGLPMTSGLSPEADISMARGGSQKCRNQT